MAASAITEQEGGGHYVRLSIQPFQFTAANGWDAFAHSILKYITRYRDKGGLLDLKKSHHIARLRIELNGALKPVEKPSITIGAYIEANKIPRPDDVVFYALSEWVNSFNMPYEPITRRYFLNEMEDMIARYEKELSDGTPVS